jgi:hypothetical protein
MQDPISKITKTKRAGGMIQVIEHVPSKHKALNSNPSTTNKKERKRKTCNVRIFCFLLN